MLYKVVQMFKSADDVVFKIVGISIKAIEQKALCFLVLFIMLYKLVLMFKAVYILLCCLSNDSYEALALISYVKWIKRCSSDTS